MLIWHCFAMLTFCKVIFWFYLGLRDLCCVTDNKFLTNMSIFTAEEMVFITIYLNKKAWMSHFAFARACKGMHVRLNKSIYLSLLFNKLSLCPYMARKPSISVILHDRYPAIYVNDHIWKCTADFLSLVVWRPFWKANQF